ncbi:MAG: hypothetical protein L3J79_08510, partial [Candidatus Marinimicrobia bacterium]|nr:hypothetical protein [Candidatus Neomarinimicrobiota bacterium]
MFKVHLLIYGKPAISGLAFYDLNGNGLYDVGEGVGHADIDITVESLDAFTPESYPSTGDDKYKVYFSMNYDPPSISGPAEVNLYDSPTYVIDAVAGAPSYTYKWGLVKSVPTVENADRGSSGYMLKIGNNYSGLQTNVSASGQAFRLVDSPRGGWGNGYQDQILTLTPSYILGSSASLEFKSRVARMYNGQYSKVQISDDGGDTWQDTSFNQAGTNNFNEAASYPGETALVNRSVDLSSYAGKTILVRFILNWHFGRIIDVNPSNLVTGWYIDDIKINDAQEVSFNEELISSGKTFIFTPEVGGNYHLSARANLEGGSLPWGEFKGVSVSMSNFTWSQVDGAEWYNLYITKDGVLWKTLWVEANTTWTPESNLPAGNYAWYVRDWNAASGDGQWTDAVTFSIGVPELLTPEGAQADGQWRPQFTWTRSPEATYYNLYISVNGALWQSMWLEGGSRDSWQSDVDMPAGSYTFYVRPWSPNGGNGPWSDPMSFSLGLPEQIAPEGLQNRGVIMPEFSWNGASQLDYYSVYLQRNGVLWSEIWIEAPASTWTPPEVLESGSYKWWLRGWSAADGYTPWSESKEFEIQGLAPLSPLGVVSGNLRPQFQWEEDPGATWYQLYVADETGVVLFYDWLEGATTWTPTTDMAESSYNWYVQSWSPKTGTGPWKGPWLFQIQGASSSALLESQTVSSGPATPPGDFNQDGEGDLVMQNSETGEVKLKFLFGETLVGGSNLSIQPGTAEWVVVGHGDIDNDQDNDLLWQNTQSGEVLAWFLENGSTVSGSLALDYQFESPQWRAITLADFDGDWHVD